MTQHARIAMPTKVAIDHVSKRFATARGAVQALDNVSLNIAEGELICLVGPSGCGKSTLLDIVAGLTHPDAGRVVADGEAVDGSRPAADDDVPGSGAVPLARRVRQWF